MTGSTRKKTIISLLAVAAVLTVASLTYLFLWGKLFTYSPIKPGFTRHELSNTIVYIQHGAQYDVSSVINSSPPAVEKSHKLQFRQKPVIYLFRDKNSYLHRSMTRARFCAYPNGSLVISPWALQEAQEGKISLEIYLQHELSHVLLYQHMGALAAYFCFPRWLLEGTAMYRANQMGTSWYPGKKETCDDITQGNFLDPRDYATAREKKAVLKVKYPVAFIYSEFGCIVDDLVATYGEEKFQQYIRQLSSSCGQGRIFRQVFGVDFNDYLQDFKKRADGFTQKN